MNETTVLKKVPSAVEGSHQEVFDGILALELSKCMVNVCLASFVKTEATPRFERLKITSEMADEFRNVVRALSRTIKMSGSQKIFYFPSLLLKEA